MTGNPAYPGFHRGTPGAAASTWGSPQHLARIIVLEQEQVSRQVNDQEGAQEKTR
jgi:hypothetical protein